MSKSTLHDQFAMAAMQGLTTLGRSEEKVAELAYKQADAMVAERERGGSESLHGIKQELIQRLIDEGIFTDKGFYQDLTVKRLLSILIDKELPF